MSQVTMGQAASEGGKGIGLGGAILLGVLAIVAVLILLGQAHLSVPQNVAQPTPTPSGQCPTATPSGVPVFIVKLSRARWPETTDHINFARTVKGKPSILTIDRPGKVQRSDEALAGWPIKAGYDRDEYPPAVALEGGRGADIRYVTPSDNSGAGASMGNQLRPEPNGAKFCIELTP